MPPHRVGIILDHANELEPLLQPTPPGWRQLEGNQLLSYIGKTGTIPSFSKMYDFHYHLQTSKIIELIQFMVKTHTSMCCLQCERVCDQMMCASSILKKIKNDPIPVFSFFLFLRFSKSGTLMIENGKPSHM